MDKKIKKCTKCGIEKFTSEFYLCKKSSSGFRYTCKDCTKKCSKINGVKYRTKNKKHIKEKNKNYFLANREKLQAYYRIYSKKRKEKNNIYFNEKYKTNTQFRLNNNISRNIRRTLKNGKDGKSWLDLVPYTLKQLKRHLEKQFTKGMTWENYGEWHIDHKIPKSVFNFTEPGHEDFKKCWALKNLQPMWAIDNLKKGANLEKHFQPSLLLEDAMR